MENKQVEAIAAFESEVKLVIDPLPASTLGMLLFLASESMFFIGMLGAFIVLKSAVDQRDIFRASAAMLSPSIAVLSVVCLVASTVCLWGRKFLFQGLALLIAGCFLLLQGLQWHALVRAGFGSKRNNYCASYFLITTVHVVHLVIGMVAVCWFLLFRRAKLPDCVQIYWHFVNTVGLFCFVALYWF